MINRTLLLTLVIAALLFGAVGCSNNSVKPDGNLGRLNLVDEFGGYTATPELAAFGDEELISETAENDTEYDDPILMLSSVESIVSDPEAGYYHLRMVWGRLRLDTTVTTPTDWSGSLTTSRGALVVRRIIRFEEGQDELLPRTERELIEWKSQTTVHHDGLAVDLFVPPQRPIFDTIIVFEVDTLGDTSEVLVIDTSFAPTDPVSITFETGPYSRTMTLDELNALDTVVFLEDSNAVAFHAFRLDRMPCPRGFLAGRWGFNDEGEGRFRGTWMDRKGRITGHLGGHFGISEEGRKLFFGKWVSRNGRFEGFIRGRYDQQPDRHANDSGVEHAGGWFRGEIFSAERAKIGILAGRYRSHPEQKRGFLQGRWKIKCPEDRNRGDDRDPNRGDDLGRNGDDGL